MKKTVSSTKKKAWTVFSKFIRLRDCLKTTGLPDYGKCVTCSKIVPRTLLQAGHFIQGRHNANLFSEKGCHAQCYNCNINLGGNPLEYRRKIIEMYGPGYDEVLEAENRVIKSFSVDKLKDLMVYYKEKMRDMEGME